MNEEARKVLARELAATEESYELACRRRDEHRKKWREVSSAPRRDYRNAAVWAAELLVKRDALREALAPPDPQNGTEGRAS